MSLTSTVWDLDDGVIFTDTFSFFIDFVHPLNFVYLTSFDQQGIVQIVRLNSLRFAVFAQTVIGILNACFLVPCFVSIMISQSSWLFF
jgi:hypothetical protein